MTSDQPWAAKPPAMASPSPLDAPVTIAVGMMAASFVLTPDGLSSGPGLGIKIALPTFIW